MSGHNPPLTALRVSREEARRRIQERIAAGKPFLDVDIDDEPAAFGWFQHTRYVLRHTFTTDEMENGFAQSTLLYLEEERTVQTLIWQLEEIIDRLDVIEEPPAPVGSPAFEREQAARLIERIATGFHRFARQLLDRYDDRPTLIVDDEYDVQDILHAFLVMFFVEVEAEETAPSRAGGRPRIDFLLEEHQIAIELKTTRPTLNGKKVGEELAVDILRYQSHPKCKTLIFFIYDPTRRIKKPHQLEKISGKHNELDVRVIVVPRDH